MCLQIAFAKEDVQKNFEEKATEILRFLITTAGKVTIKCFAMLLFVTEYNFVFHFVKDHHECDRRWKALLEFCKEPANFEVFQRELSKKGVSYYWYF